MGPGQREQPRSGEAKQKHVANREGADHAERGLGGKDRAREHTAGDESQADSRAVAVAVEGEGDAEAGADEDNQFHAREQPVGWLGRVDAWHGQAGADAGDRREPDGDAQDEREMSNGLGDGGERVHEWSAEFIGGGWGLGEGTGDSKWERTVWPRVIPDAWEAV